MNNMMSKGEKEVVNGKKQFRLKLGLGGCLLK